MPLGLHSGLLDHRNSPLFGNFLVWLASIQQKIIKEGVYE